MCNRLPAMELLKFNLKSHRLPKTCTRLPVKNFRKSFFKRHISSNHFEKARRAYIYIYIYVWLQKARERYSKRTSLPNVLWTTLGQTLANLLRVHPGTSICIIHSKGEKSFCSSQKVSYNQETGCLLYCEFFGTQGKGIPQVFRSCKKDFLQS